MTPAHVRLVAFGFAVCFTAAAGSTRAGDAGPEWLGILTPTGGWLRNETRFHFKAPAGRQNGEILYKEHEATMTDDGAGGGLTLVGFYKWISVTDVFFHFWEVNQSRLVGNILYLSGTVPTPVFVEPYLGMGFVWVFTDTDYVDFNYALRDDETLGAPAVGYAHFERISVDNQVLAPFPKIGAKLKIPVQHWYVTPFYSYMYESVATHARSPGGGVKVYYVGDKEAGRPPQLEIAVPPFDTDLEKEYNSHLAGADFFLDFHYFLQLRGKVYYNASWDLWTVRLIGSLLLNERVGISVYFEYSEKITVTNMYMLVGPAFVIAPPGYLEEMMARRKARAKAKEAEAREREVLGNATL